MSTVRMVERTFAPGRSWFSLVDVVTDRVVCGGLRSAEEAEQWVTGEGHTLSNPPIRLSGATKTGLPPAASIVAPDSSSGGTQPPDRPVRAEVQTVAATARPAAPSDDPQRRALRSFVRRADIRRAAERAAEERPPKETFPCCAATRDEYGRLCIGYCGPDCLRRPARRTA